MYALHFVNHDDTEICPVVYHAFIRSWDCSRYPSPVHFFNHKCIYTFHHPFEATRVRFVRFLTSGSKRGQ